MSDETMIRSGARTADEIKTGPWILAATILGSSMAFIDGTVVNVALPAVQINFHASVVDVQWAVESYGWLLAALILSGGSLGGLFGRRRGLLSARTTLAEAAAGGRAASGLHPLNLGC